MIRCGILNPSVNSLLARIRHTNMLVIADRGFPFWATIETVDLSLVDDIPTVLQVLSAIRANFEICEIRMAEEFVAVNALETRQHFSLALSGLPITYLPHTELKKYVPQCIGLIRTGDTIQYANMILVSGSCAGVR